MFFRLALVAIIAFQIVPRALAEVTYISCPVSQVRKEIISPIVHPWRQEPDVRNLSRLWIRGQGRDQELFCGYGSPDEGFLPISRRIPNHVTRCWPEDIWGTRFICEIRHLVRHMVIPRSTDIDLDDGVYGDNPQADFWFQVLPGNERYFVMKEGVGAAVARRGPATPDAEPYRCDESLAYGSGRILVGDLPQGSILCMRTNRGNYSRVQIEKIDPPAPELLVLSHVSRNSEGEIKTGTLRIPPGVPFDLDEGQLGESSETDVLFQAEDFLEPLHGAGIAIADADPTPGAGIACDAGFTYRTDPVPIHHLRQHSILCVRTSRGIYSKVTIQAGDPVFLLVLVVTTRDR